MYRIQSVHSPCILFFGWLTCSVSQGRLDLVFFWSVSLGNWCLMKKLEKNVFSLQYVATTSTVVQPLSVTTTATGAPKNLPCHFWPLPGFTDGFLPNHRDLVNCILLAFAVESFFSSDTSQWKWQTQGMLIGGWPSLIWCRMNPGKRRNS